MKAKDMIESVVSRCIASGSPIIREIPRPGISRFPSAREVDNVATMMPRIIAARRAAKHGQHLTKPGRSATHFTEPA